MTAAELAALVRRAKPGEPEPPRPLIRDLPRADPFPVDALGRVLGDAVAGINQKVQAPLAICGQSVLAAATLAVQGHGDVRLPTGQVRPISEYFMTVAESGERKSATDAEALWPIRQYEQKLRAEFDISQQSFINDKAAWDKARDTAIKCGKGDRAAMKLALDRIGPPPDPPLIPMLTCPEPTFEGLCRLLAGGHPSMGIFSAEGGQFIGGHGMSEDSKLRTAAGLSHLWDGEPVRRVRAGDGVVCLPGRRVAMHLMAQPDAAAIMLSDRMLVDQGLLSRFLVTAPEPAAGSRLWKDPNPQAIAGIQRYSDILLRILEKPLPLISGKTNELASPVMELRSEARRMWTAFADNIEVQIAPDGALASVRSLANKAPEHATRIAAVLALVDQIDIGELSADYLAKGILLAQHYVSEALRLFEASRVNSDLKLAQRLLAWLHGTWQNPLISLPDVYQRGLNAIGDQATARRMVAILENHGWLTRDEAGAVINGYHRRDVWHILGSPEP